MKKFLILFLSITIILTALVSCSNPQGDGDGSGSHDHTPGNETGGITVATDALKLEYNGVSITPNAEAQPILEALGDPLDYGESPSCFFEDKDRTYQYNGFIIDTCVIDGVEYIYFIELINDSIETPEGAYIGMTPDEIQSVYAGKCSVNSDGHIDVPFTYGHLVFYVKNGVCNGITYESTTISSYQSEN